MPNGPPICHQCHRPIREGDARWSGRDREQAWHYACATAEGLTLAAKKPATTPGYAGSTLPSRGKRTARPAAPFVQTPRSL